MQVDAIWSSYVSRAHILTLIFRWCTARFLVVEEEQLANACLKFLKGDPHVHLEVTRGTEAKFRIALEEERGNVLRMQRRTEHSLM